jgi:hypothetical protein
VVACADGGRGKAPILGAVCEAGMSQTFAGEIAAQIRRELLAEIVAEHKAEILAALMGKPAPKAAEPVAVAVEPARRAVKTLPPRRGYRPVPGVGGDAVAGAVNGYASVLRVWEALQGAPDQFQTTRALASKTGQPIGTVQCALSMLRRVGAVEVLKLRA